ncbi:MAG: MarR family transcriptional regulator [Methanobrevibacter sp.]|jgi:putative transcriptional regulator|nr:MarR family transcriptional regulator [Candidatus Methanovirga aequatorialis]
MKSIRERGEMTKLQILYEVSKKEIPYLRQKDIANRLGITIQAISENIKILIERGYITTTDGKSPYHITLEGIDKITKEAVELRKYSDEVLKNMDYYKSTWPAIAAENLKKGEKVGIFMKDGILRAAKKEKSANAVILTAGMKNEDVALTDIHGIIDIERGDVVVITIPTIQEGGSKVADLDLIKSTYDSGLREWGIDEKFNRVGVLGTVAYGLCLKLAIPIDIEFAVTKSTIEAAKKGLNVLILAVGKMTKNVLEKLEDNEINYHLLDGHQEIN